MDPVTIATTCVSVIAAIVQTFTVASDFVKTFREARDEIAKLKIELRSLQTVLEYLRDDTSASDKCVPAELIPKVYQIVGDCRDVMSKIQDLIRQHSGSAGRMRWAAGGKKDLAGMRTLLAAYETALGISLQTITLHITKSIKVDTTAIKADTLAIREDTQDIKMCQEDILKKIDQLKIQLDPAVRPTVDIEQYLADLSSYAETVTHEMDLYEAGSEFGSETGVPTPQLSKHTQQEVHQASTSTQPTEPSGEQLGDTNEVPKSLQAEMPMTLQVGIPNTSQLEMATTSHVEIPEALQVATPKTSQVKTPKTLQAKIPKTVKVEMPKTPQVEIPKAQQVKEPHKGYNNKSSRTFRIQGTVTRFVYSLCDDPSVLGVVHTSATEMTFLNIKTSRTVAKMRHTHPVKKAYILSENRSLMLVIQQDHQIRLVDYRYSVVMPARIWHGPLIDWSVTMNENGVLNMIVAYAAVTKTSPGMCLRCYRLVLGAAHLPNGRLGWMDMGQIYVGEPCSGFGYLELPDGLAGVMLQITEKNAGAVVLDAQRFGKIPFALTNERLGGRICLDSDVICEKDHGGCQVAWFEHKKVATKGCRAAALSTKTHFYEATGSPIGYAEHELMLLDLSAHEGDQCWSFILPRNYLELECFEMSSDFRYFFVLHKKDAFLRVYKEVPPASGDFKQIGKFSRSRIVDFFLPPGSDTLYILEGSMREPTIMAYDLGDLQIRE